MRSSRRAAGAARSIVKVLLTRGPAVARGYGTTGAERPTRLTLRYGWQEEDLPLAAGGVRVRTAALRLAENPVLAGLKHSTAWSRCWHGASRALPGSPRR